MTLAFAAGVLAAINPCGFALLPAYVSFLITGPDRKPLLRAGVLTAAMTLGFVTLFGAFGLLAAPAADWLSQQLPWLTVVIGLLLLVAGVWLLLGRELPSPVPKPGQVPRLTGSFWSMYLFGLSFAIASLGCTVGPFLAVVVSSFQTESLGDGVSLFLAYTLGMALVIGVVSVATALAQQSVIRWMRRAAPVLSRAAGVLMVLSGAYVAWYGYYEIRLFADPNTTDPVVEFAGRIQTWLSGVLDLT